MSMHPIRLLKEQRLGLPDGAAMLESLQIGPQLVRCRRRGDSDSSGNNTSSSSLVAASDIRARAAVATTRREKVNSYRRIIRDKIMSGRLEVQQSGRLEVQQSGRLEVQQSGRLEVQQSGRLGVQQSGRLEVQQSGRLEVQQSGRLEVQQSGRLEVQQSSRLEVQQSGRLEVQQSGRLEVQQSGRLEVQQSDRLEVQQSKASLEVDVELECDAWAAAQHDSQSNVLATIPEGAGSMDAHTTVSDDDSSCSAEIGPTTLCIGQGVHKNHDLFAEMRICSDKCITAADHKETCTVEQINNNSQEKILLDPPSDTVDVRSASIKYGALREEDAGSEFYWELEYVQGKSVFDSDPFVFRHLLWRFSLQLRPSRLHYEIKVGLLSPTDSDFTLSCEFKMHCMLRPPHVKYSDRRFPIGPGRANSAFISDFISTKELHQNVRNDRILLSGRLWLCDNL